MANYELLSNRLTSSLIVYALIDYVRLTNMEVTREPFHLEFAITAVGLQSWVNLLVLQADPRPCPFTKPGFMPPERPLFFGHKSPSNSLKESQYIAQFLDFRSSSINLDVACDFLPWISPLDTRPPEFVLPASSYFVPEKHHKLRMLEGFLQSLWDHGELVVVLP